MLAKTVKGASTDMGRRDVLARRRSFINARGGLPQHHGGSGEHTPKKQPPGTAKGMFAHRLADKLPQSVRR